MTEPASPDKRAAKYGSHFNRRLSSRIHRRFASGPGWVGQGRSRDSEAAIRAPYGRLRSHSPLVVYSRGSGIERLGAYFRNDGTSRYRQSCPRCTRQARRSRHGDGWSRHESQQYSWNIEYQLANRRPPRRYPPWRRSGLRAMAGSDAVRLRGTDLLHRTDAGADARSHCAHIRQAPSKSECISAGL
jgi:hypothetical protein